MIRGARHLLVLALAAALVGFSAVYMAAPGGQFLEQLRFLFQRLYGTGPWAWVLYAGAGMAGLGLVLTLAHAGLALRGPQRPLSFENLRTSSVQEALREVRQRLQACVLRAPPDVVAAFDELMRGALEVAASDLHLTPTPDGFKVTYRVQGTLHEVAVLDATLAPLLTTRVKVLARLDTYVRATPQDGRLAMELAGAGIDARVSTLPTELGERVVLRIVRGGRKVPDLDDLGFSTEALSGLRDLVARPQGLIFVTGPVGSGKTTTLYAALKHIARSRGRTTTLVTLEDPIELELPFATQTQIHQKKGISFASGLRSVLRQDPNVLMVGEIRDRETAQIAVQAGLTGHLILTTVHAESAAGPFARLADIEIEPFASASASIGSLSQRLVRTLCTACRREAAPSEVEQARFAKAGVVLPPGPYYAAVGCEFCQGQGFTDRTPISELLVVNSLLERAITERRTTAEIYELAVAEGMTPLLRDGLARAERGVTSLSEVLRVAG